MRQVTNQRASEQQKSAYKSNPFYARFLHPILDAKDNDFWTKPTKIRCWYCAGSFPNSPFPLPTNYNNNTGAFTTSGVYCSLTCVKSHIRETGGYFMGQRLEWLTLMSSDVFNFHEELSVIDKYRFEHFGGDLAHADYLRMHAIVPTIQLRSFPFVDAPFVFEQPFKDEEISKMHIHPVISTSSVQTLSAGLNSKSHDAITMPPPIARAVKFPGLTTMTDVSFAASPSVSLLLNNVRHYKDEKLTGERDDISMTDANGGEDADAEAADSLGSLDQDSKDNNRKKLSNTTQTDSRKRKNPASARSPAAGSQNKNKRKTSAAKNLKSSLERKASEMTLDLKGTLRPLSADGSKKMNTLIELMNIQ